jgi:hypothetical protein
MEIMRVPPYPLTTIWNLPIANYTYVQYVEDLIDHSVVEEEVTSDENGIVEYVLPLEKVQFDRKFLMRFYDTEHEHILYEENLDVIRPYVDPSKLGTTASEIAEYKMLELVARSLVDTYVNDGFYNHKQIVQTTGQGTDYFSLWDDTNKVLKAYENNILVYDVDTPDENVYDYIVTLDNSAIQRVINDNYNRAESTPGTYLPAYGDLGNVGSNKTVDFPKGYDYTFILDTGFKAIPVDVEYATKVLIEDLKCGKLDYYKRYVTGYNTDQFRIQFDKSVLDGTGNMLVDKILDKYVMTIVKPGIL